jgi:transketolase
MDAAKLEALEMTALEVRKDVVRMTGVARAKGIFKALNAADMLVYIYWAHMRVYPGERNRPDRDRFVLGKGSVAPALYACLARLGFFGREELWNYGRLGAMLQGRTDIRTPGVDSPAVSPGDALGLAAGMTAGLGGGDSRVFCLMDESEMTAGSAWESAVSAASDRLGGLVLIVDSCPAGTAAERMLESCGWLVSYADGNDMTSIERAFDAVDYSSAAPKALLSRTSPEEAGAESLTRFDVENILSEMESGTPAAVRR